MAGLFDNGRLETGQSVLIHGAPGRVGSVAVQRARDAGARVIVTSRAADRDTADPVTPDRRFSSEGE